MNKPNDDTKMELRNMLQEMYWVSYHGSKDDRTEKLEQKRTSKIGGHVRVKWYSDPVYKGSAPYGITSESEPENLRIAEPNVYESNSSYLKSRSDRLNQFRISTALVITGSQAQKLSRPYNDRDQKIFRVK